MGERRMCGPDWEFGDARGGGEELRDADGAKVVYFIFRGADLLFFAYKRPRRHPGQSGHRTVETQSHRTTRLAPSRARTPYHVDLSANLNSSSGHHRAHVYPRSALCRQS